MIDHVSVGVRDLDASARFYERVLATLGYRKLVVRSGTVGFGKRYADFWINKRPHMLSVDPATGSHVCLRAASPDMVQAFHAEAVVAGGSDDGAPGPREHDDPGRVYYAAFIRDPDGNRVEAVCFVETSAP